MQHKIDEWRWWTATYGLISIILSQILLMRFNALYDYSYITNISYRIFYGELPWRDFDLMVTPGVFYVMGVFYHFFGYTHFVTLLVTALSTICSYLFSLKILSFLNIFSQKHITLLISSLITINSILAFPFYDNFASLFVLLSLYFLLKLQSGTHNINYFYFGVSVFIPFLFKQNIGIFYVFGILFSLSILLIYKILQPEKICNHNLIKIGYSVLGFFVSAFLFYAFLRKYELTNNFFQNTFVHAGNVKGISITSLMDPYLSTKFYLWVVIMVLITLLPDSKLVALSAAFSLFAFLSIFMLDIFSLFLSKKSTAVPFDLIPCILISGIFYPLIYLRKKIKSKLEIHQLIPAIASITCFGALTSQGFWGSNYAIWPLLILTVSMFFKLILITKNSKNLRFELLIPIFGVWILAYGYVGERFNFVDNSIGISKSEFFELDSLPLSNSEISNLLRIKSLVSEKNAEILEIPMEDPLPMFFDSFRFWGNCPQLNNISCQSLEFAVEQFKTDPPDFLLLKTNPQLIYDPENYFESSVMPIILQCFPLAFDSPQYQLRIAAQSTPICTSTFK